MYADPEHGLISIAETLGLKLLAPRKKITIMLIGNHSAGKSSFINWYVILNWGQKCLERDWVTSYVGTLKNMCSGQGWQLRPKDSPSLHRAGLRQLASARIPLCRHLVYRRRESLTGNATLHLYPHFKPLQAMPGIIRLKNF